MELACFMGTWHVGKPKNLDKFSDDFTLIRSAYLKRGGCRKRENCLY